MRDELLALLEAGPQTVLQLVEWLNSPEKRVLEELRRMNQNGLVKRVATDHAR